MQILDLTEAGRENRKDAVDVLEASTGYMRRTCRDIYDYVSRGNQDDADVVVDDLSELQRYFVLGK